MTGVCRCGYKCVKCLCCYFCDFVFKYFFGAVCFCVVGMVLLAVLIFIFSGSMSSQLQTAALDPIDMNEYDQLNVSKHHDMRRSAYIDTVEDDDKGDNNRHYNSNSHDDDKRDNNKHNGISSHDYDNGDNNKHYNSNYHDTGSAEDIDTRRSKRNLTASGEKSVTSQEGLLASSPVSLQISTTVSGGAGSPITTGQSTSRNSSAQTITNKLMTNKQRTTDIPSTASPDEYDPDFHLGHKIMDAVFGEAEKTDMKQNLGLCRKNADVKIPEVKATLFPAEQASDILSCINDLLKAQAKKQICLHLDPEMNAYLKWLVLTGESKEKHQPVHIVAKEDFLFPSSCATATEQPVVITPECLAEPVVKEKYDE